MKEINFLFDEKQGYKKAQVLYVLWVLENYTDESNPISQDEIVEKLAENGYETDRRTVGNALRILKSVGYNIEGVNMTGDDDRIYQKTRGKIWLKRDFTKEQIALLINSIKYNIYVDPSKKAEIIDKLLEVSTPTLIYGKTGSAKFKGSNIYHMEGASLLVQLGQIEKAIEDGKKIRFRYGKLKRDKNKFRYVESNEAYTVSPYWIVMQKGNTYLVCYNHNSDKIEHYRVDKMKNVEVIKSTAHDIKNTELKGTDLGSYVSRHPNMFTGEAITVQLKVNKEYIGHVYESFNVNSVRSEDESHVIVDICCGEKDMFYWAVQFGGVVEVLSPQKLRDSIRIHIEGMAMKYLQYDSDKYAEAIRKAIRTKVLDLSGVDLKGKRDHQELKRITKVYLSNNKIDNFDFLKGYTSLEELHLENNAVTDLSCISNLNGLRNLTLRNLKLDNLNFVEGKYYTNLTLGLGEETNYSALLKIRNTRGLKFDAYRNSIPWAELDEKGISYEVDWKDEEKEEARSPYFKDKFPFNFLHDAFGSWSIKPDKIDEVELVIDKIFNKFNQTEKSYLNLHYKQEETNPKNIIKTLKISEREYEDLKINLEEKITHPAINEELKQFFIDGALDGKFQNSDVIFSFLNLSSTLEKRKK